MSSKDKTNETEGASGELNNKDECQDFMPGFLSPLNSNLRKSVYSVLHGGTVESDCENNSELLWEKVQLEIETELGLDSLQAKMVAREFAMCLCNASKRDEADKFLNRRLERLNKEDFWTLMELGKVYQKSTDYSSSFRYHERAKAAIENEDKLKMALVLIKMAVDVWNLETPPSNAFEIQMQSVDLMEDVKNDPQIKNLNSEASILILDTYKTAAYLYRVQHKDQSCLDLFQRILTLLETEPQALIQKLKIYTHITAAYSRMSNAAESLRYLELALDLIDGIVLDHTFMMFHFKSMIHITSRISFSLERLKQNERALQARQLGFGIANQFLSEYHPEKARIALDIAWLYNFLGKHQELEEYIEIGEEILENCDYEDILFLKIHIREISDAMMKLGRLFTKRCSFAAAETQFKKCLSVTTKVYGEHHQRLARIYQDLGFLYLRWQNTPMAEDSYLKCIAVLKPYLPATRDQIDNATRSLDNIRYGGNYVYRGTNRKPRGTGTRNRQF